MLYQLLGVFLWLCVRQRLLFLLMLCYYGSFLLSQGHRALASWHIIISMRIQVTIPVVFDRVVCASIAKRLRYLRPLTPMSLVKEKECLFLSLTPFALLEEWVKVVMPSLSALLRAPTLQQVRYFIPVSGAMHVDYLHQSQIFFWSPHVFLSNLNCSSSAFHITFLFPLHRQ